MKNEDKGFLRNATKSFRHSIISGLMKQITPKLYEDFLYGKHDYLYNFTVPQLIFLCECIEKVRDVNGVIAEIGVYEGATSVFLNKYMDAAKIDKKYYAIDTFSGFVDQDITYEVSNRQKNPLLYTGFKTSKNAFDVTMNRNDIQRVVSIQADVNEYNLTSVGNLSFALLDVDLYRPMKKSLKELYRILSPNGIIIVDDCDEKSEAWDGSDQAYKEFMQEINQPVEIKHSKLGIVRK
jgi:O-methyltransferase